MRMVMDVCVSAEKCTSEDNQRVPRSATGLRAGDVIRDWDNRGPELVVLSANDCRVAVCDREVVNKVAPKVSSRLEFLQLLDSHIQSIAPHALMERIDRIHLPEFKHKARGARSGIRGGIYKNEKGENFVVLSFEGEDKVLIAPLAKVQIELPARSIGVLKRRLEADLSIADGNDFGLRKGSRYTRIGWMSLPPVAKPKKLPYRAEIRSVSTREQRENRTQKMGARSTPHAFNARTERKFLSGSKRRGRPKKWTSEAERHRAYRARKREASPQASEVSVV